MTVAAIFTAIEVAMDRWQQHDGREDLGTAIDVAVSHLSKAFSG